jgi:cellulose 1,4-beta-cellobiosidase
MQTSTRPLVQIPIQRLAAILVGALGVLLPAAALAQTHVDNPFIGATVYANPDYAAKVQTSIAQTTDATLRSKMQTVAQTPTFVWLDRIAAIAGGADSAGLQEHLDNALAQRTGSTPIVAQFVVYDLPGRDCAALASNGEIPLTAAGLAQYKTSYIDEIARIMAMPAYAGIRIVTVIEPDSLPNLVTNLNLQSCAQANSTNIYAQGVQYALNKLHAIPNVYTYLDIGHSGWLGWPNNASGAVSLFSTVVDGTTAKRASVDGFVTDTANDIPLKEPFLNASQQVGGQQLISANFFQFDPDIDEVSFTADLYSRFTGAGWPTSIGFLIDTSRNGWGGPGRPTAAGTSTDLNTFVNQSKIDTRQHRGLWCNQNNAGLGERPQAAPAGFPASHLDAFVWVKPPGDSDGASSLIPNDEGKGFDRMCDPTFTTQYGVLTNAIANAPLSGHWFHAQFVQLVQNAFPPVGGGGGPPPPTCAVAPAAPATFTAAAASATTINLAWSAVAPPANCSIRYNLHRGATANFTPTTATQIASGLTATSFVDNGRIAATTYFYALEVVDAAGTALARTSATTPTGGGGQPPGGGTCHIGFTVTNSWSTGFQVALSIQNTGTAPINGWTLTWSFPGAQSVGQLWNGAASQTGTTVTVKNMSYNATIAAGASYNDVGFVGNGASGTPTSFTLNGTVCN